MPCDRACASCASPDPRNCTQCAAGYEEVPVSPGTRSGIRCIALTPLQQHTTGVASPPPKSPDLGQTDNVVAISLVLATVSSMVTVLFLLVFSVYFRHRLRNMRESRGPKYPPPPVPVSLLFGFPHAGIVFGMQVTSCFSRTVTQSVSR